MTAVSNRMESSSPPRCPGACASRLGCRVSPRSPGVIGWEVKWRSARLVRRGRPPSGGREGVSVELHEVVGGGDESPLGADGAASSSSEAIEAAVELRLREHRLDHWLALAVE